MWASIVSDPSPLSPPSPHLPRASWQASLHDLLDGQPSQDDVESVVIDCISKADALRQQLIVLQVGMLQVGGGGGEAWLGGRGCPGSGKVAGVLLPALPCPALTLPIPALTCLDPTHLLP